MVRPNAFHFNPETAISNGFMNPGSPAWARAEFDELVGSLRHAGIEVRVFDGPPGAPDAVFPNNWMSSHDGKVVVYPMCAPSRRLERSILARITDSPVVDLTHWELEGRFLEGTGSLVLDRPNRIAFASLSPRTDPVAVREWCEMMDYWPVVFETFDRQGKPIYHTNVALSVGSDWAVFCAEACASPNPVLAELKINGKEVIEIGFDQLEHFCGNVIELKGVIVASKQAWHAFSDEQKALLSRDRTPVIADISSIEAIGGGSVRCMIAEWFD